jgi:NIMA (never in mitosis gene a)-related kinase
MKRVKIIQMNSKDKENALNEIRILASVKHQNIIDYKESFYDEESQTLNIVMEYADNGDLSNKIRAFKTEIKNIIENEIWSYCIQIILGLKAFHDKKIMHRDLKSANIFLNKLGVVKIGDLNVSKVVKMGFLCTQTGTPYYASPEVWAERPYDYRSDMWSVGCIIYELCALKPPFRGQNLDQLFRSITKGVYDPIPSCYSKELQIIISLLLQVDPKKRPTCDTFLANPIIVKKIESGILGNVTISTCEGNLLNTIKVPTSMKEINANLSKLKRYTLNAEIKKIKTPESSKNVNAKCFDKIISSCTNSTTGSNSSNSNSYLSSNLRSENKNKSVPPKNKLTNKINKEDCDTPKKVNKTPIFNKFFKPSGKLKSSNMIPIVNINVFEGNENKPITKHQSDKSINEYLSKPKSFISLLEQNVTSALKKTPLISNNNINNSKNIINSKPLSQKKINISNNINLLFPPNIPFNNKVTIIKKI